MKRISTSIAELELKGDIIYARLANGIEVEDNMVIDLQLALEKLAEGKKYKVILDARDMIFGSSGANVYENSKRTDIAVNRVAQALVSNLLPTKIMIDFYAKQIKAPFPTKSFKTIEEAEEWLKTISTNEK